MSTKTAIDLADIDTAHLVVLQDAIGNVAEGLVEGNDTARWVAAFGTRLTFATRARKRGRDVAAGDPTEWQDWKGVKGVRVVGHTATLV